MCVTFAFVLQWPIHLCKSNMWTKHFWHCKFEMLVPFPVVKNLSLCNTNHIALCNHIQIKSFSWLFCKSDLGQYFTLVNWTVMQQMVQSLVQNLTCHICVSNKNLCLFAHIVHQLKCNVLMFLCSLENYSFLLCQSRSSLSTSIVLERSIHDDFLWCFITCPDENNSTLELLKYKKHGSSPFG